MANGRTTFQKFPWCDRDLARAVGRTPSFDEAVVEREITFAQSLSPQLPPHLRRFKDPHPVPEDASAIDRLAALLGRTVPA
ncbi:hypothetical protein [Streptomyces tsukubensis]|uniref:hypothetical protein n=1 Tax=Streptomyces tsukubensis TaxID=83656 RepID=UPI00117CFAE8|nr:hypothetical protein [Streptomyces tsukubensis]QFR96869.1 hypothetical protein GBW32_32285 [Streptomyces tsukubensis]